MLSITSLKNPLIQRLKSLKDRASRVQEGLFLVEGQVMIREALSCSLQPKYALFQEDWSGTALMEELAQRGAQCYLVPRPVLQAVCPTKTPQGACCAFALLGERALEQMGHPLVALDGVQDPGNVGTIWRTADAAGFQGMILGMGSADPLGPKVQRAAMGSGFRIPFCQTDSLAHTLDRLRGAGYAIIVSELEGENIYARATIGERFVLVVGSEAHGASEAVKAAATHRLKLPMRGGAESLNAAVAAGIMMYELMRDR